MPEGMTDLAEQPNMNVKLSGLGTFVHACRADVMAPVICETVAIFGADRCLYGSNFPIEKTLDRLYGALQDISRDRLS